MESKEQPKRIQATYDYNNKHDISEIPKDFKSLKEKIKELFHMNDDQINKITISYLDDGKIFYLEEEKDFERAKLLSEQIIFKIEDIVEEKDIIINDTPVFIKDPTIFLKTEKNDNGKEKKKGENNEIEDEDYFIDMLTKPDINIEDLNYIKNSYGIYVNLFEIKLHKDIILYQYPFKFEPAIEPGDIWLMKKILKYCYDELKSIFGECFIMGNSLYGFNKVEELKTVKTVIKGKKGRVEFKLEFDKYIDSRIIKQADVQNDDKVVKLYLELLIKDILNANKKLDYYKRLFVKLDERRIIESEKYNLSINFFPGYTTSLVQTQAGKFLNVTLRNKIIQKETILDYLKKNDYKNPKKKEKK
jgi:hypothetical protein